MPKWTILENAEAIARVARDRILSAAREAIAKRGRFSIVLAGGSTPAKTYELLANEQSDWQRWHIYFGDERCLPRDHPDRNSRMAAHALLEKVAIPSSQIHPIPAELGPETAAQNYSNTVEGALPFDLVLLGLGEDGHTASLFPGQHYPKKLVALPVHNAPKPPSERVSLSTQTLSNCRQLIFLVSGKNKRSAVSRWHSGSDLPVGEISAPTSAEVLIDFEAFGMN